MKVIIERNIETNEIETIQTIKKVYGKNRNANSWKVYKNNKSAVKAFEKYNSCVGNKKELVTVDSITESVYWAGDSATQEFKILKSAINEMVSANNRYYKTLAEANERVKSNVRKSIEYAKNELKELEEILAELN